MIGSGTDTNSNRESHTRLFVPTVGASVFAITPTRSDGEAMNFNERPNQFRVVGINKAGIRVFGYDTAPLRARYLDINANRPDRDGLSWVTCYVRVARCND